MDAYIDPTNPKKGFNTIQLVESKNKVTCLDINNSESNWNFLKEFVSLKSITLKNCIIDTDLFFEQLENLEVLIVVRFELHLGISRTILFDESFFLKTKRL